MVHAGVYLTIVFTGETDYITSAGGQTAFMKQLSSDLRHRTVNDFNSNTCLLMSGCGSVPTVATDSTTAPNK